MSVPLITVNFRIQMGDIMSALRTPLYFRGPPRSDGPFTSCSLLRRVIVCFTATNMSFAGFVHYRRTLKATGAHAPATNFTENFNDCLNEAPNLYLHVPVQSTEAALCEWLGISPQLLLHHKIVFELSSYTLITRWRPSSLSNVRASLWMLVVSQSSTRHG